MTDMEENNELIPPPAVCAECHAGMMQPRLITYFTWLGEELITVPHFPSWVCDVCGRREYDEKAITWLNMILDPNAGQPTKNRRKTPVPPKAERGSPRPFFDS